MRDRKTPVARVVPIDEDDGGSKCWRQPGPEAWRMGTVFGSMNESTLLRCYAPMAHAVDDPSRYQRASPRAAC